MMVLLTGALAAIQIDGELHEGHEVVLHVTHEDGTPAAGETVRVTHHPTLPGSIERAVNISDARGRVVWTPEHGGLADVRAGSQQQRVRIRPASPPPAALSLVVILLFMSIGLIALGARRRASP